MVAGVTALLLAIVTAVLRLRLWGLAALSAGLVELCLAMVVWPFAHRIGLAGDSSALLCIPLACVATALVGSRWPART